MAKSVIIRRVFMTVSSPAENATVLQGQRAPRAAYRAGGIDSSLPNTRKQSRSQSVLVLKLIDMAALTTKSDQLVYAFMALMLISMTYCSDSEI